MVIFKLVWSKIINFSMFIVLFLNITKESLIINTTKCLKVLK